ncbi:MAG TPA: hypothetical protein VM029_01710 [Opitutaceae bacterium]|nr:hypothetical protein [Opitutaceae bacterium]
MYPPRKLLVIDFDADSGALLLRSLLRKFPAAAVELCKEAAAATQVVGTRQVDAVVLHRTEEEDAVTLVRTLRKMDADIPIIVVSGIDRSEQVLAAGATGFLNYAEWLMIGQVVSNALQAQEQGRIA